MADEGVFGGEDSSKVLDRKFVSMIVLSLYVSAKLSLSLMPHGLLPVLSSNNGDEAGRLLLLLSSDVCV